jgi:ribokinase
MGRVLVLGSLNVDLVAQVGHHPRPGETVLAEPGLTRNAGGKGANQAVAAVAAGADVAMAGAVGDDGDGTAYLRRLEARGVDVSGVRVAPDLPTGQAWIAVDDEGENTIVVVPGANSVATQPDLTGWGEGDVLLVQLEVPLDVVAETARDAHRRGMRVVVNAAPYAALPHDVAALADPVVVNEHEAAQLADGDVVPGSLLVTFGAAGCTWDGEPFAVEEVPADQVVDTTGAGDAFCGALAASLAAGLSRDEAMRRAAAAGAEAVTRVGAQADSTL